jgi:uncharacterized membrane protein (DUF4010 family)
MEILTPGDIWLRLTVALAAGLLIGLERGFAERDSAEGSRLAGLRTHALLALLGAISTLLGQQGVLWLPAAALLAVAAAVITGHVLTLRAHSDFGLTSVVAALLTFGLGALAMEGRLNAAAGLAVVTALLLSAKTVLHEWVRRIERQELVATLQLLLISVVLLPVLPDAGYGPWQALNPYEIWWMVVLIAGVSYAGYFAVKVAGERQGLGYTALFGGLVSSTAVTLNYARLARESPAWSGWLAGGVLLACGVMFGRTLLLAGIIQPRLLAPLAPPLLLMMAVAGGTALFLLRRGGGQGAQAEGGAALRNPFELFTALKLGLLLTVILLLAEALRAWLGQPGLYLLALVSGVMDVDPVTLSVARLVGEGTHAGTAALAILLAVAANTVFKGTMAVSIGGGPMARWVGAVLTLSLLAGLMLSLWLNRSLLP